MESINGEHKEVHRWNVPIVNTFLNMHAKGVQEIF